MNRRLTGFAAWGGLALLVAIPAAEMLMRPAPDAAQAMMQDVAMAGVTDDGSALPGPQPKQVQPRIAAGDAPGVTPMGDIPLEVRLVGAIPVVKSGVQIAAEAEAKRKAAAPEPAPRIEVANLVAPVPMPAEARPIGRDDRVWDREVPYWARQPIYRDREARYVEREAPVWDREPRPWVQPARASEVPDEEELANDPEYQELLRRIERERNIEAALAEASRPGRRRPLVTFYLGR